MNLFPANQAMMNNHRVQVDASLSLRSAAASPTSAIPSSAPFPSKLYRLLEEAHEQGFEHIVSWIPGGNVVRVHNVQKFCSEIMPKYFKKQSKFSSFTRQLYLYGFMKVSRSSRDNATFFHPQFVRGNKVLSSSLKRTSSTPHDRRRKLLGYPIGMAIVDVPDAIPTISYVPLSALPQIPPQKQASHPQIQAPVPSLSIVDDLFDTSSESSSQQQKRPDIFSLEPLPGTNPGKEDVPSMESTLSSIEDTISKIVYKEPSPLFPASTSTTSEPLSFDDIFSVGMSNLLEPRRIEDMMKSRP